MRPAAVLWLAGLGLAAEAAEPTVTVLAREKVVWEQLNPARGDQSPKAATLWGDRSGTVPTGFLVQFVDGFSSPPHVHNVSYRGVVVSGLVHNADAAAPPMWMPPTSYWTQPKEAAHITAATGPTVAYIEIDEGPYLVRPVDQARDSGERPVNVDASNLVWLDMESIAWLSDASGPSGEVAFLWGDPDNAQPSGSMLRLPPGFEGTVRPGGAFRAVTVAGQATHEAEGVATSLSPGSTFASTGAMAHGLACAAPDPCVLYVRSEGPFRVTHAGQGVGR